MKKLRFELTKLIKKRVKDSIIAKIALVLAVFIVFCTTYLLILPALTVSTRSSSSVIQSTENSSSVADESRQDESSPEVLQKASNQTESSESAANTTDEAADMVAAGTLSAETSEVTVTVTYEDNTFSEPVTLKVNSVSDTSAINDKLTSKLSKTKQSLSQAYSYDISFVTASGEEVEPSKDVNVSLAFKNAVGSSDLQSGWKLYHFVDNDINNVEDLTNKSDTTINQDSSDSATGVEFKSDSFSTYTVAGVTYADFSDYIVSGNYKGQPVEVTSGNTKTLTSEFQFSYNIPKLKLDETKYYALELPDNITWTDVNENEEYSGKYGTTDAYKYRFVQSNGKKYIVITFLESYIANAGESVRGDLGYTATIGQTYRKETGDYEIPFTDKVTITVPSSSIDKKEEPQQAQYDVSSNKWGNVTYDGDSAYLNYTVEVSSNKGTKDVVNLTDTLKVDGFKIESFEKLKVIRTNSDWSTTDVTSGINLNESNGKFTTQLPKLGANQKYTITYRYKISGFPAGKSTYVGNGLDVTTPDIPNQHKDNQLELYRNKISKSGSYDKKTNKVKWTIIVNENQNDIAGAELKDDMIAKSSDVEISPSEGATKTSTGYKFTATSGGRNTNKYTITYTTDAGEKPSNWAEAPKTFTNTATITDGGESSSASTTVIGENDNTGGLDKAFKKMEATSNSDIKELTWQFTIKVPGSGKIPSGTEFEDVFKRKRWHQQR